MAQATLPLLIEPRDLTLPIDARTTRLVDLCSSDQYLAGHIPGAVHLAPSRTTSPAPRPGPLPGMAELQAIFAELGHHDDLHYIVYDDEGGGWAGRLIWTLDAIGHHRYSYLNGGLHAWLAGDHPVESGENTAEPSELEIHIDSTPIAEIEDFITLLDNRQLVIWDARSPEEYRGEKVLAERGGHIPGAVNLDWLELMDKANNYRFKDLDSLKATLESLGITPDRSVITHCQTHHRSGLSYLLMKILNF